MGLRYERLELIVHQLLVHLAEYVMSRFFNQLRTREKLNCLLHVSRFSVRFWATVYKTVRPMVSDRRLSVLSVTLVYCGQTVRWIKMKLGMEVGLGPGHIVLDGDPAPPKRSAAPNFRPMSVPAKRLDGSRCHLVRRSASAQATLC